MITFKFNGNVLKITDNNDKVLSIVKTHIVEYFVKDNTTLILSKTNGDVRYKLKDEVQAAKVVSILDAAFNNESGTV